MYIMCIVCLGYLSFLPTSAIASVLCTCISMYMYICVGEPHFIADSCGQQLRKLVLELIHRLPTNDHLKGHVKVIAEREGGREGGRETFIRYHFSLPGHSLHYVLPLGGKKMTMYCCTILML